jgi:tetratricopeptide (TPR) repeat protein
VTLRLLATASCLVLFIVPPALAARRAAPAPARQTKASDLPEDLKKIALLYNSYKDEEAYAACNEYLVAHPLAPMVVELRARCLKNLGKLDDAVAALRMLPPPMNSRSKLLLAECLSMTKGGGAEAEQLVNEVAADDPNGIEPRLTRARVFLSLQKFGDAAAELKYVLSTSPNNYEAKLLSAMMLDVSGQFDRAMSMYLPLVQKPSDFEIADRHFQRDAVVLLASVYMKLQRYDEGAALWEQIVGKFPPNADYLLKFGICQAMKANYDGAMATLEKGVQLAPDYGELRWRLAELYRSQGKIDQAIEQFEQLLAQKQGQFRVTSERRLAELYLDKGLLDKAKIHAETALTLAVDVPDGQAADVLDANGRVREKMNDVPGAKDFYRRALAKNPLKFDTVYRLAQLLARSDDAKEKEESAALLARHDRTEKFRIEIERTMQEVDLNPLSPLLLTRMAGLLNLAGEYEQAKSWGERSAKLNARSPSTYVQLGYIYANLKDNANALKSFEQVKRLLGKDESLKDYVRKLDEYIEKLKKGEELPLPLGEYYRPAQPKKPDEVKKPDEKDGGGK